MKQRLGIKESKHSDCGCGCGGTTPGGCGDKSVNEEVVNEASMAEYVLAGLIGAASYAVPAAIIGKGLAATLAYLAKKEPQLAKKGKLALANESVEVVNEQPVMVSKRTESGNIVTTLKEVTDLNEEEMKLYEFGQKVEKLMEKSCPTDKGKWAASKAAAKSKFDVYPSAYANGWAAKNYKSKGGGWRDC